jgi:hypothetical protein
MTKKNNITFCFFLVLTLLTSTIFLQTVNAQPAPQTKPLVAIHISEYTQNHWTNSYWNYFALYTMLEEAFKSDGTPFVEVSDAQIEAGDLLLSGTPNYPILFSLACECVSDQEATQLSNYVSAGGFIYAGASSWTRYANGTQRSNFALSAQMGLRCTNPPPNNWAQVQTARRVADHQLVNCVPANVNMDWRLPLADHTLVKLDDYQVDPHYAWRASVTSVNPAQVLMTIDSKTLIAIKQYNAGWFIYNSELDPLASYSLYSPMVYEYLIIRQAVSWAFQTLNVPLVKLSPWPYQYNSAFIVRHDMDFSFNAVNWMLSSAQTEKNLGVTGQYYIVTGDVRDSPDNASLISLIQQAYELGAQVGSHNGGLNCTPWKPEVQYGDYEYYHWTVDDCLANYPTGLSDGMAYANQSIALSLADLQNWVGNISDIWVSPGGQACWDESFQVIDNLNISCSGEFTTAPFPQFAFSLVTENVTYGFWQVPFSRWITSSGVACQNMEEIAYYAPNDMPKLVDFYYNQGLLVSPYSHSSSESGMPLTFLTFCLSKPYMWNATPTLLRDWCQIRQQTTITPQFSLTSEGLYNLTLTVTGASSSDIALDVNLPVDLESVSSLQVLLNGAPSSGYRIFNETIKVQSGQSSTVTILYSTGSETTDTWVQTSQADFQAGTLNNLDVTSVPGQLSIAMSQTSQSTLLFSDDFSNSTWTSSQWTAYSGSWTVNNGLYNMAGTPNTVLLTYGGNASWSNYIVETRERYISGEYAGALGARFNPSTGARYTFFTCPNPEAGGPNTAYLVKFTSWADITGTMLGQASVTTDTNWHLLKMELNGTRIKCYYDGNLVFNMIDGSLSSGMINFESFSTSNASYDWVNVTTLPTSTSAYYTQGTLTSSAFDSGNNNTSLNTFSYTASTPNETAVQFRTRTAQTQADLSSANWSSYITTNNTAITSSPNQWIQYEAELLTNNTAVTPILYDVTITYSIEGNISADWVQTSQTDFQTGTLSSLDAASVPGQLTLSLQQNSSASVTTVLFSDDFSNATWTSSHWTVRSGSWNVSNGYYNMVGSPDNVILTYAGNASWTDYTVEARTRYISGEYTGELSARLNPATGSRYSLMICPALGGPNMAYLIKFSSWDDLSGVLLGQSALATDTNWHNVKIQFNGSNIKCYYDDTLLFNVNDGSCASGLINFESFGVSNASFDWINVTSLTISEPTYYYSDSGTLVSLAFDSGSEYTNWTTISWTATTPNDTSVQFRVRTAATQSGLSYADWSEYYYVSNSTLNAYQNRWIQYEATLSTSNSTVTPILYDVTIHYTTG